MLTHKVFNDVKGVMKISILKPLLIAALLISGAAAAESVSASKQLQTMLTAAKGKVVYLDFWASWCGPCRKSFPWMNKVQNRFKAQGFTVISVNLDKKQQTAQHFLDKNPNEFSVIYDPNGDIAKQFSLKGMPSSYLFDKNGNIVIAHVGFFEAKIPEYEMQIAGLLNTRLATEQLKE